MARRWLLVALVLASACKRTTHVTVSTSPAKPTPLFSAVIVPPAPAAPVAVERTAPRVFTTPIPTVATTTGAELHVDLHADGSLVVDGSAVRDDSELADRARDAASKAPDVRAIIRADKSVAYGRVIAVMNALKRSGISKIAFAVGAAPPAVSM